MLIPEPSTAVPQAVTAAAATFAVTLEAGAFYELASSTNCWISRATSISFSGEFVADAASDKLLFASAHGLTTGDGPFQLSNSGGALPGGTAASTNYWIIVVDSDEIKLATSLANALAGTAVNVTDAGTGAHTMASTLQTVTVATVAVAGTANGSMFVPAGEDVAIAGATTVSGVMRTKISIIRDSADGKASLTKLAQV